MSEGPQEQAGIRAQRGDLPPPWAMAGEVCKLFGGRNKPFGQADALPDISGLPVPSQSFPVLWWCEQALL